MSEDPARLSLKLCKVLERIGVSESMRNMYRDVSITKEVIRTIQYKMTDVPLSLYYLGSSCEGTATPGMDSDLDVVQCVEKLPVIEDIRDAPPGRSYLMVTSRHTQPGYVKLQAVQDGTPLTIHNCVADDTELQYDCEGRVCLKHMMSILDLGIDTGYNERNGPADSITNNPNMPSLDAVDALRCKSFPHIATEALKKCTTCCWMSDDHVEKIKRFGILLVGVGHQASKERDIEWRISFSLQERELMLALNPIQHKCYVLLKIIKNRITAHPEVGKSLTSYHCKTCLFTVITDTTPALWTEENLVKCTFTCLMELIDWVSRGHCPNFFIKQNNMFNRPGFVEARERLLHYMKGIIHEGPMLFYNIESDFIRDALRDQAAEGRLIDDKRTAKMCDELLFMCQCTYKSQQRLLVYCHYLPSKKHITHFLFQQLRYLSFIDTITEHTQEQTQMAVRHLKPVIHKLYAQQLASVAFSTEDPAHRHRLLESSTHHLRLGRNSDRMSASLLKATILYRAGNLESCRRLLEQIELSIMHGPVMSFCMCTLQGYTTSDDLKRNVSSGHIKLDNIMESSMATCIMFLPSQSEIVPKALQYEMYRSVGANPASRLMSENDWFEFAAVDSKIYLYFLKYLVYSGLRKPIDKLIAVDQILNMLISDRNLQHRETACNLLGWIYTRDGYIQKAIKVFYLSWRIRPDHNAARWHLPGLLVQMCEQQ